MHANKLESFSERTRPRVLHKSGMDLRRRAAMLSDRKVRSLRDAVPNTRGACVTCKNLLWRAPLCRRPIFRHTTALSLQLSDQLIGRSGIQTSNSTGMLSARLDVFVGPSSLPSLNKYVI